MPTKVRINRASINIEFKLMRQFAGRIQRTDKLVRAFKRGQVPKKVEAQINQQFSNLVTALLEVFSGGVTGIHRNVNQILGVRLGMPWDPLTPAYAARKATDSFWFETGDLLNYVSKGLQPIQTKAVSRVDIKHTPVKRGDKHITVNMLYYVNRLEEPLQSTVIANFLQGRRSKKSLAITAATDLEGYKILVNEALRSFIPDVSAEYGNRLLQNLSVIGDG